MQSKSQNVGAPDKRKTNLRIRSFKHVKRLRWNNLDFNMLHIWFYYHRHQLLLYFVPFKRKIYSIFWADLFCLHTDRTKIGKVRIMPLFAAYGDIAYFKQNLSLYHISNIWIEIIDIFASKSRLLFQKEFSWSWIGQRTFVDVKWLSREVISEQSQSGKFDLHLNLSWNTEIGSFHHPLYRAPW